MKSKLIAYAIDFTSFLIQKIKEKERIRNIILFGSVSREEAETTSDIDIFIDTTKENIELEKEIKEHLSDFLKSTKYKNYWKMLGIKNEIKLKVGELNKWKGLKPSIVSNGILLYGKFKPEIKSGKHKTFFIWENIKPNSKRVLFNKQLLGYKQKGKFYQGLIQKYKGERLGKGCIVVDLEYANIFHKLFKKYKATVKIKKVYEYS
ncbi:MAG: nucleotidyltransferase domain-containing protein [Candidatus Woesearchaeota archaeon]